MAFMKLDVNAAKANDAAMRISQAGKYTGTFTLAEYVENKTKGSTGINLEFVADDGAKANFYINLSYGGNTQNDGGYRTLNAIMACLRLRELSDPVEAKITKRDKDTKKDVEQNGLIFADLQKRIGVVVQIELGEYEGKPTENPRLYTVFEADTELLAAEILEKVTKPEKLANVVAYIAQKGVIDKRQKAHPKQEAQAFNASDDDFDLPF